MSLENEVITARKRVSRDGYDMSFGELASVYENNELFIQPEYQRLRVWDETQKTRFIESVLLNIPIPPIFVFASRDGKWELVDGLQRVSTIFEFMGVLREVNGAAVKPFVCGGTSLLPSLDGNSWSGSEAGSIKLADALQVYIKRARIRVEILNQESDLQIKYELFQRLNTGGSNLSRQEIRNCIIISINKDAHTAIMSMALNEDFRETTAPSGEERAQRSFLQELVVRFIVLRHHAYRPRVDVHDYLDEGIMAIASSTQFDWRREIDIFNKIFHRLNKLSGDGVFKKGGRFSLGYYEFIILGLSSLLDNEGDISDDDLSAKIESISKLPEAGKYTGSGVRGTQRLSGFVFAKAKEHFLA
ncbi:DUF262 domain-containing protein [Rhodomicrobium sp.]|jgi:hypothetical protein|uniref:DUF262 domain-containing protein n=1 Tax=Rhodomicrobium sp. TaxID=2720632 RepID=UPI0039E42408